MAWYERLTKIFSKASATELPKSAEPGVQPENLNNSTSLSTKSGVIRSMWTLLTPYFMESEDKARARTRLVSLVALSTAMMGTSVYANHWSNNFITSAQALIKNPTPEEQEKFNRLLEQFALLTAGTLIMFRQFRRTEGALKTDMNAWMLQDRIGKLLEDNVHVRLSQHTDIKNPTSVMANSIKKITEGAVDLGVGAFGAAITLPPFAYILYNLSGNGDISAFGQTINVPGYLMWGAFAYAGLGIAVASRAGKPLESMHTEWQKIHADLNSNVINLQTHAKEIALYGGETAERKNTNASIEALRSNEQGVYKKATLLDTLRRGDNEVGFILPYMAALATAHKTNLSWGDIVQGAHAFYNVQGSLRWYFDSRNKIAEVAAAGNIVMTLDTAFKAAAEANKRQYDPSTTGIHLAKGAADSDISFKNLTIYRPQTQEPLLENFTASIPQGSRIVVMAPSGWGKTTLINTLAGHGGDGHGTISMPHGPKTMIVPQGRFIPRLSLREILSYPETETVLTHEQMAAALTTMGLERLIPDLDHDHKVGLDYEAGLSGGESQRLIFARILLAKPDILIVDELTSALDKDWEQTAYKALIEAMPRSTLISISHRPGIIPFHTSIAIPDGQTLKFLSLKDQHSPEQVHTTHNFG